MLGFRVLYQKGHGSCYSGDQLVNRGHSELTGCTDSGLQSRIKTVSTGPGFMKWTLFRKLQGPTWRHMGFSSGQGFRVFFVWASIVEAVHSCPQLLKLLLIL